MRKKVTIDNGLIAKLATDPVLARKFPFLLRTVNRPGCCGAAGTKQYDYNSIKQTIANLSGEGLRDMKTAVGAETIAVFVRRAPDNLVIEVII